MRSNVREIDHVDACALPALRTAYDALARGRGTKSDIRAALNAELRAFGLQPITNGAFSAWGKRIGLGTAKPPAPGLHTTMVVEGLAQRVDRLEVPALLATVSLGSIIQVRIVELIGGLISPTILARSFTGEALRRGWVDFDPIQMHADKRYAIHFSSFAGHDSCLVSIFDGTAHEDE